MSGESHNVGGASRVRKVVALLVVAIIGLYCLYRWYLYSQVQKRLEALAASGAPITLAELDASYKTPPYEQDATDTLTLAHELYRHIPGKLAEDIPIVGKKKCPRPTEPISEDVLKMLDLHVMQNERSVNLAHEGAAMGHARWPCNLNDGPAVQLPHLAQQRQLCRLIEVEALSASVHGDAERATQCVVAVFGLAHCLADEPLLISQLVRIACVGVGWSTAEQVLTRAELNDEQLARLETALKDAEPAGSIAKGLSGERCTIIDYMQTASDMSGSSGPHYVSPLLAAVLYVPTGVRDMDMIYAMDEFDRILAPGNLPSNEQCAALNEYQNQRKDPGPHLIVSNLMMPSLQSALEAEIRSTAELRTAQAAVVVERYRLAHGALPASHNEIASQLPIDPFSGAPCIYKRLDEGFITYSININSVDDNGTSRREFGDYRSGDIVFQVGR